MMGSKEYPVHSSSPFFHLARPKDLGLGKGLSQFYAIFQLDRGVVKYCYDCLLSSPVSSHGRYQIPSIISVLLHEARSYYVHHAAGRTFSMTIPLP